MARGYGTIGGGSALDVAEGAWGGRAASLPPGRQTKIL